MQIMQKYKEHHNMMTKENLIGKKTWRVFNLAILKVKTDPL